MSFVLSLVGWMVSFKGKGCKTKKFSPLGYGVHEDELNTVSLTEIITTEQGINHGTICKLKIDGMDLGVKGN